MKEVMTAREASAELFGGKPSYWMMLEMAKKKAIPHFRLGGRVFFRRSALIEWIVGLEKASFEIQDASQYGALREIKE